MLARTFISEGSVMKAIIENTKYITLVAVIALMLSAVGAFIWGALKTYNALALIVASRGKDPEISAYMIQVIDAFLVALAIYIFALSIYVLFIGPVNMPDGMLAHNYHELKVRLGGLIILVAAVYFVEKVIEGGEGLQLLYTGAAITLVSAALVAFSYFGDHN